MTTTPQRGENFGRLRGFYIPYKKAGERFNLDASSVPRQSSMRLT